MRFLLQFHHILIYVLLCSAVITAVLNHWIDTLVILMEVLANAIIGFVRGESRKGDGCHPPNAGTPCLSAA